MRKENSNSYQIDLVCCQEQMCADTRIFKLKARLIIINNYFLKLSLHNPSRVLCICAFNEF